MTVLHTGWTKEFGSGWESIFGGKKAAGSKTKTAPQAATGKKKSAKKRATPKKSSKGKR